MTEQVIKFENKEYIWEEVEGKGKCLVPYKEQWKIGDYLLSPSTSLWMVTSNPKGGVTLLCINKQKSYAFDGFSGAEANTVEELSIKYGEFKDFRKVNVKMIVEE